MTAATARRDLLVFDVIHADAMLHRVRLLAVLLLCVVIPGPVAAQPGSVDTTGVEVRELTVFVPGGRLSSRLHHPGGTESLPLAILVRDPRQNELVDVEAYTGRGIALLEVDPRGMGESTGDWRQRTIPQLATDMLAAMRRAQQEPGIHANSVGFVGMNRGGWIALEAAARADDAAFLVTVGTPFATGIDQVLYEEEFRLRQHGVPEDEIRSDIERLRRRFRSASAVPQACRIILDPDLCSTLAFDPQRPIRRVQVPALAVFGEGDPLVPAGPNVEALTRLDANRRFETVLRRGPDLSHSAEAHEEGAAWIADELTTRVDQASTAQPPASVRSHSFYPMPSLFYNPETGWGGGASVTHTLGFGGGLLPQHPTVTDLGLIVTERRQVIASLSTNHYTRGNSFLISVAASHIHFPETFYGVGADLPTVQGERYVNQRSAAVVAVRRRLGHGFFLGGSAQVARHKVLEADPTGQLAIESIAGGEGGATIGLGVRASWDTRDHVFTALRGSWLGLRVDHFSPAYGSDFTFTQANLDARYYHPLSRSHRLAFQFVATASRGDVPFQMMPRMGGPFVMRGYVPARYRNNDLAALQGEYRADIWGPLGAVAFAHLGGVAENMFRLDPGDVRAGFGGGLRIALGRQDRLNFRADYAFGDRRRMLFLTMGEAF